MKTITPSSSFLPNQRLFWGVVLLLAGSLGIHAAVLENPDFETGDISGWETSGELNFSASTNETFNRNYAARISGTHSGSDWITNTISQTIPIIPGNRIDALGFVYWKTFETTAGGADGYVEARLDGPDGMSATQTWTEPHDGFVFFDFSEQTLGLANSGFEETLDPWEKADGDLDVLLSRDIKYSGDSALSFHGSWTSSEGNEAGWSWNEVSQGLNLESGMVLRAHAWINVKTLEITSEHEEAWAVAGIKLEELDEEKDPEDLYSAEDVVPANAYDTGWQRLEFLAVIPNDGFYAFRVMVCGNSQDGTNTVEVYLDDVWIEPDPVLSLANGDFETGDTTSWNTATDNLTIEVTDERSYEGDYSLRVHGSWSGWSFDRAVQEVYLQSGDEITFSGQVYVDTLDISGGWAIAVVMLERLEGGEKHEWKFESWQHGDKGQWVEVDETVTITQAGTYEFVAGVMGDVTGSPATANVYFDDLALYRDGDPEEGEDDPDLEVTLSLSYIGMADGGENTVDLYLDVPTIRGSSAALESMAAIHQALLDESEAIANSGAGIPDVKYPPLFAYGYAGDGQYPSSVEAAVAAWRFRYLTNDVTLTLTNTLTLGEMGAGPGYIEFDRYGYVARKMGLPRGEGPIIDTNAPHWLLGDKDGTSNGFGDGPFGWEHTFVVGQDDLSDFPRRLVNNYDHYGQQWPVRLNVVFQENMSEYDRDYDKYFLLTTLPAPEGNIKSARIYLNTRDPVNTTQLVFQTQEMHMGWATEEESRGMVDYPNITYQDHNEVSLRAPWLYNLIDHDGWFAQQVPRGSATIEPLDMFIRDAGKWVLRPYEEYLFNWPNAAAGVRSIFDCDQTDRLPGQASYHVGFKVGHQSLPDKYGDIEYPIIIEIRGNGYFRMTDFGGVMGGSFRPVSSDIFGFHKYIEDAPLMPQAYVGLLPRTSPEENDSVMHMYLPVRSKMDEWFTGVIKAEAYFVPEQLEGDGAYMDIETDIYANRAVNVEDHGTLNLFAQVNMYWRGGGEVNAGFEGHDHDVVLISRADGEWIKYRSFNPPTNIYHTTLSSLREGDVVYIKQQDRGPASYPFATEAPYRRVSNFELTILDAGGRDLSLDVYSQNTISEINDNIVFVCAINEDIAQGERVHGRYRYRALYAPGVLMVNPLVPSGGGNWDGNTYTIEFYATDGDDEPLEANIYYGTGLPEDWTLINTGGPIPVCTNTHLVEYGWDVSGVPAGAYYIRAEAWRPDDPHTKTGFDISDSRLQVGGNPVTIQVDFQNPPMTNPFQGDLPHYNPGEDVIQVLTISNVSGQVIGNVNIQLLQEYGETTWWWDTSHYPHMDSERTRRGDRLIGDFQRIWTNVTIPADGTIVLTNVYTMPAGRFIDRDQFAIPTQKDWYVYRNYDAKAQVRVVIREENGHSRYENDQIALYSMDDNFDLDNDGLPDYWETEYFGGPTNASPTDLAANNRDTLLEAYIAGLDPTDPLSRFIIIPDPVIFEDRYEITVPTQPGREYVIYYRDGGLLDGVWSEFENEDAGIHVENSGVPSSHTFIDDGTSATSGYPLDDDSRFYRVRVQYRERDGQL